MNKFTLEQLETFVHCAETGSFSHAARRMGKSQSTVSSAISNLETDLGILLFDRTTRKPGLTLAGKSLLAQAKSIVDNSERLYAQGLSMSMGTEEELIIAVNEFMPYEQLESILQKTEAAFPELAIKLYQTALNDVRELVCTGKAHLGFASGVLEDGKLDFKSIDHIHFMPMASPQHPLANHKNINFEQINQYRQVMVFDQSNLADDVNRGVFSPITFKVNNLALKIKLMRSNFGWGMLPSHIAAEEIKAQQLVPLDLAFHHSDDIRVPIYLVWAKNQPLGKAAQFIQSQY